jgi:shikimate kinase
VKKASNFNRCIIATGGGAVLRERNLQNLRSSGMLFCLDAAPEVIFQRTSSFSHRPLLQVEDPIGQIRKLLQIRESFYAKADHRIDTSQLTVNQVADIIANLFRCKGEEVAEDKR